MIKRSKKFEIKADTWLRENFEYVIDNFAGRYVVIVDNKGIVFTDKDGDPREVVLKAKKKFPRSTPLFFRVPRPEDFLCALNVR